MTTTRQLPKVPDISELNARDYIAVAALSAVATNVFQRPEQSAQQAYAIADAMMTARERRPAAASRREEDDARRAALTLP
jgi:hypothetical protein